MIGYGIILSFVYPSLRPFVSVMLCLVAKRYIPQQKCPNKSIRSVP